MFPVSIIKCQLGSTHDLMNVNACLFQKTHVIATQTVKSDTQDDKDDDEEDEEPVSKMPRLSPPPHTTSDAEWQARLDKTAADISERLKKQHEDDKAKALKELTDRVSCHSSVACVCIGLCSILGKVPVV